MNIFNAIDKFFNSLNNYLTYNEIFIIFVALSLFAIFITIIATANSYEAKLIKAIDMFNNYFVDTPNINEDNLVVFNQKMKSNAIPKQLRKQWQQFVLYREGKASSYMSFENCVSNPLKNSTFKRDIKILNIISYILAFVCLVFNCYAAYENDNLAVLLQHVLLSPAVILLLNYIVTIFLNIRHNSIVTDLYQNYQYFEVNIDKATQTLPEYVDYEMLFDKAEIKRGIPILYAYLQKRAEDEKRELEMARLRNVEHERFNFDEAGVEGSLVLERAMHEAENYIAERKKYNQDTEQINADISQEDINYREITKEYNRQMQVSRETFANFKSQLENVTSTIEANYLKKQQQQELDRQRNLERDFDTATERHKKVIESYQQELDSVDEFRAESRKALEDAMMSEFETYSNKVYEAAKKIVEEREKEKTLKLQQQIQELEETIVSKEKELDAAYNRAKKEEGFTVNNPVSGLMESKSDQDDDSQSGTTFEVNNLEFASNDSSLDKEAEIVEDVDKDSSVVDKQENISTSSIDESIFEGNEEAENFNFDTNEDTDVEDDEFVYFEDSDNDSSSEEVEEFNFEDSDNDTDNADEFVSFEDSSDVVDLDDYSDVFSENQELNTPSQNLMSEKPKRKAGRPRKEVDSASIKPKRRVGRPKKEKVEQTEVVKKRPGRPRKENADMKQPNNKVGRPKKELVQVKEVKRSVGRPKKVKAELEDKPKKKVGRPKKEKEEKTNLVKKGRGRPKKQVETKQPSLVKKGRGRPKKVVENKQETSVVKKGRGRPRKQENIPVGNVDIDAYLQEINEAIKKENEKIAVARKALAKKASLRKRK